MDEAIEVANEIAPEHLTLSVDRPFDYLEQIRHAGALFLGRYTPPAVADYVAGPNHVLPTGGDRALLFAVVGQRLCEDQQYRALHRRKS